MQINKGKVMRQASISQEFLSQIRQEMDRSNVGINENDLSMHLAAPFTATDEEIAKLNLHGRTIETLLATTAKLYAKSINEPSLHWLRDLFEAELDEAVKVVSREGMKLQTLCQPNVVRPDFINFDKIAEVGYQVNGLGLCNSLGNILNGREPMCSTLLTKLFAESIKAYTDKASPLVSFFSPPGTRATEAFTAGLRDYGVEAKLFDGEDLEIYDVVFWRSLSNVVRDNSQTFLLRRGNRNFVPALTCLPGSKIYQFLPFHEETRKFYPDTVRDLLPEASLVTEKTMWDLLAMSNRQRAQFVLKYAGQNGNLNWGARSVFKLGNASSIDGTLLRRACESPQRSPWLVQERIRSKYEVMCLDDDRNSLEVRRGLTARITPRYVQLPSGSLKLAASDVMFSTNWKCHGNINNWVTSIVNLNPPATVAEVTLDAHSTHQQPVKMGGQR